MELPEDVRTALLNNAKNWVLTNYVGGKKELNDWDGHYASLTYIKSFDLPGDRAKNLRRLVKLADQGLLIEKRRRRKGEVRTFTLPREQLDALGREAVQYWQNAGYVIGRMMSASEM